MVLPWDKDFLSSKTELSSKTILYASEGQNVNNVSRSIVKKILGNIDSKEIDIIEIIKKEQNIMKYFEGMHTVKTIYVPKKLINFVKNYK